MNRSLLNLTIDLLAGACLVVMMATGYILFFPLPPSTNRTHKLWELSRHEWGAVHSWASVGLLLVVFVHIAMHWHRLIAIVSGGVKDMKSADDHILPPRDIDILKSWIDLGAEWSE